MLVSSSVLTVNDSVVIYTSTLPEFYIEYQECPRSH